MQQIGGQVAEIQRREREKAKSAAMRQAELQLRESGEQLLRDPDTGFLNKQGGDAFRSNVDVQRRYEESIRKAAETIRDPDTKQRFLAENARALRLGFSRAVNSHTASERSRFEQQTLQAILANSAQDAGRTPTDKVGILNNLAIQQRHIEQFAADNGLPAEARERMIRDAEERTHDAVLQGMIQQENYGLAKDYLENEAAGKLSQASEQRFQQIVDAGALAERSQAAAADVFQEFLDAQDFSTRAELEAIDKARQKLSGPLEDHTIRRIRSQFRDHRQAEMEDIRKATAAAASGIMQSGTRGAALKIAEQAPQSAQAKLLEIVESEYPEASDPLVDDDLVDQARLSELRQAVDISHRLPAGDPRKIDSEEELIAQTAGLSKQSRASLLSYYRQAGNAGQLSTTMVKDAMAKALGSPSKELPPKDVGRMFDAVSARMNPGEEPTLDRVKKIVAEMYLEGDIVTLTAVSRSQDAFADDRERVRALDAFTEGRFAQFLSDIPEGMDVEQIRKQMAAAGLDPNPPGETEELDAERLFFREQIQGLPQFGRTLEQRNISRAAQAAMQRALPKLRQARLDATTGVVRATIDEAVEGEQAGVPVLTRKLAADAQDGKPPRWMTEALKAAGSLDQFLQTLPEDPSAREERILQVGMGLIEGATDAR